VAKGASDWIGKCVGSLGLMLPNILGNIDHYLAHTRVPVEINDRSVSSSTRCVEEVANGVAGGLAADNHLIGI